MINSMTAFAREADAAGPGSLVVEIRSVNHRYLDCNFKLHEQLRGLEPDWRTSLQKSLARGKVECQLRWQADAGQHSAPQINSQRLHELAASCDQVNALMGPCQPPDALAILQWPGVLQSDNDGDSELQSRATRLFQRALQNLQESRAREGAKLAEFISERLQGVLLQVDHTRRLMPELMAHQRQRLLARLADVSTELEPQRLEQEMVLLAQKTDVEEELDRSQAHVEEVQRVLAKGGPCGRRLDFLMQELNREANTLSSKSISSISTQNAVELKVLIEQMREQIQNLE
jgi:uncharacterized protein (TIGR00255 family)